MELMGDGLIAFLAAVGVSTILWLLAETLLRRHRPVAEAILVLPVRGDGATLERALRLTMEQRTTASSGSCPSAGSWVQQYSSFPSGRSSGGCGYSCALLFSSAVTASGSCSSPVISRTEAVSPLHMSRKG